MALATQNVPAGEVLMTASGAISDGQLVTPTSTARTVIRSTASLTQAVGIAQNDAATGESVPLFLFKPMARVKIASTIAAGTELEASATAGVARAYTSGVKIGIAAEAGVTGDSLLFYPY
jgi:hypothetical protein